MKFILLFGPPAVGKMTVGQAIQKKTSYPVFHNHISIEPALRFFSFGSPSFDRFVLTFRQIIFEESIASGLPGLTFTYVWDLDSDNDLEFVKRTCEFFEESGADVLLVELKADLSQRLIRNKSEERLQEKPSKRDTDASEQRLLNLEGKVRLNSDGNLSLKYKHIVIDNSNLSPEHVANLVINELG